MSAEPERRTNRRRSVPVIGSDGTDLGCACDSDRLMAHIDDFAAMTSVEGTITRLAFTQTERDAHELFAKQMQHLGLTVRVDPAGNTIAERAGTEPGLGAIGTGSHLDSVPDAGRFDGIAGVAAALEVARLCVEHDIDHRHPLRFVAFAAEEGARFGQACLGSRFAAGLLDEWQLTSLRDRDGVALGDAMRSVGLDPFAAARSRWSSDDWAAFVELHVEQGGVLETSRTEAGIVDLVSGSTRLRLHIHGQASHSGATPMNLRNDALAAAAEVVLIAESLAGDPRHRGTRTTVGQLDVTPGSITTIPGSAAMSLDVRDVDSDRQRSAATEIVRRVKAVCDRRRVGLSLTVLGDTSPVVLPIWMRLVAAQACRDSGVSYRVLTSGASHDSQMVSRVCPAAVVFVPSRGGLSHVPEEWTSSAELATGTSVLLSTLLRIDEELHRVAALARGPEEAAS